MLSQWQYGYNRLHVEFVEIGDFLYFNPINSEKDLSEQKSGSL